VPVEAPSSAALDPRVLMIDKATAMLGQPYLWGGHEPGGFDCSGLVYYSAAGAGVKVPRTALEQSSSGIPLTRDAIRAGDLVFMHLQRKELHVGIALSNERFIHAPSSGGHVRIDSLDAPPYAGAYLGARRIIAEP
jgi:cell wall-associated NlpC family hydrolase